jgi:Short C-terminal domain
LPAPEELLHDDPMAVQVRRAAARPRSGPTPADTASAPPAARIIQTPDPLDQIERLGSLRDRGLITDEEFESKKRELLDRM